MPSRMASAAANREDRAACAAGQWPEMVTEHLMWRVEHGAGSVYGSTERPARRRGTTLALSQRSVVAPAGAETECTARAAPAVQALCERPPFVRRIRAGETPDMQAQHHTPPPAGQISRKPQIGAAHPLNQTPQPGHRAPAARHLIPIRIASPCSSADTTATSGADRNSSSSKRRMTSFTAQNCQPRHGGGRLFSGDLSRSSLRSTVTQSVRSTEIDPEPKLVNN